VAHGYKIETAKVAEGTQVPKSSKKISGYSQVYIYKYIGKFMCVYGHYTHTKSSDLYHTTPLANPKFL